MSIQVSKELTGKPLRHSIAEPSIPVTLIPTALLDQLVADVAELKAILIKPEVTAGYRPAFLIVRQGLPDVTLNQICNLLLCEFSNATAYLYKQLSNV